MEMEMEMEMETEMEMEMGTGRNDNHTLVSALVSYQCVVIREWCCHELCYMMDSPESSVSADSYMTDLETASPPLLSDEYSSPSALSPPSTVSSPQRGCRRTQSLSPPLEQPRPSAALTTLPKARYVE